MKLKLVPSLGNEKFIVEARKYILDEINLGPPEYIPSPLDYAFYIFAYEDDENTKPFALAEGFILDQAYKSENDSPYHTGTKLGQFAKLSNVFHIRSTYIVENFKRTGLEFIRLVIGMIKVAKSLGIEFITTATTPTSESVLSLYPRLGLHPIGQFSIGKFAPLLYIGEISNEPGILLFYKRFEKSIEINPLLLQQTRLKKAAHL